ncbi:MAG TPA: carboxypeptidase-like regulatory domain-containing protein [Pyrinomonadaceae bacterium]|nr:carboxypeptidase-like regulatory domain-containing protein [Pyrinomonadaceae bacterium]
MSLLLPVILLLVLAPCAARAQAGGADKARAGGGPSRSGVITGHVRGEDGRPLAEALVQVIRAYARQPGQPLAASTDIEGRFRVTDVEPGLYGVNVLLAGYVNSQESRAYTGEEDRYYRPGDNLSVTLAKGGVITGTVRDANDAPVIAVSVRALRVRDAAGRSVAGTPRAYSFIPERLTDDRGIFRIFGLPAGTYLVAAGGGQRLYGAFNAYLGDAPTYFPSSTRDTANEVTVRVGEEVSGIDIRYRNERGHTVSGTVSGATEDTGTYGVSVILRRSTSGEFEGATVLSQDIRRGFSFGGVGDGEYDLTASQWRNERGGSVLSSIPRRVTVRGANVTGLALTLAPLASVEGRVRLEPAPGEQCGKPARTATVVETAVNARRAEKPRGQEPPAQPFYPVSGATPTEQGEFTIRNLLEGSYRLTARLPLETWYARSISLPGAAPKTAAAAAGGPPAGVVALKMGQTLAGVDVRIAQDGASIRGRVRAAEEGAALPANLRVYLVPAERERAEDVLRYSEVSPADDGTFTLTNLAPGRYKLLLRPVPETELTSQRPLAWDAVTRAQLRREAEAPAAPAVELKPCQRVADYELRYAPAAAGKP